MAREVPSRDVSCVDPALIMLGVNALQPVSSTRLRAEPRRSGGKAQTGGIMAARKKKKTVRRKAASTELIISKARTKASTKKCNVGGDFYGALDKKVREMIACCRLRAARPQRASRAPSCRERRRSRRPRGTSSERPWCGPSR